MVADGEIISVVVESRFKRLVKSRAIKNIGVNSSICGWRW